MSLLATIFQDADFGGAYQSLQPGKYRGENLSFGEYQVSSLKVPFGLNVTLFHNWECYGDKLGDFSPGGYAYVGDDLNDKTRSVEVLDQSIFYTSCNSVTYGNAFDIDQTFDIPTGYLISSVKELTKAGNADWNYQINGNSFKIHIHVEGGNNDAWCGVAVQLKSAP